ncbi:MAG: thermonuclease family protein [Nitrospira sp.]|nr:thermonuclease family protein [Nitrospira sp.]
MHLNFTAIMTLCFLSWSTFWWDLAQAYRLSASSEESTLQKNCDLCWNPAFNENSPSSTLQPHRQRRPSGSHPHKLPKGRYKIAPRQKNASPSALGRISGRRTPTSQSIRTIDGDTLRMGPERIRLRGIDTPELNEPRGPEARQRLEQLLKEGPIRIVPHGQDVYGRTVADVFVNGKNVAEVLKQEGYSKP